MQRFALLLDGGFVKKRIQRTTQAQITVKQIQDLCDRIVTDLGGDKY